jgi:2-hydroxy-3-keto-5-methylthiopentenyl-1-phosphate phosphatase
MNNQSLNNAVVMCDFDGTITNIDTAEKTLELFADPEWRGIERGFENGEVSFEDSLQKEYALIEASPEKILKTLDPITVVRPHFERLVQYCKSNGVPLMVVSGGLDFCIQHFLARDDWLNFLSIHAPTAQRTANGYNITLPKKFEPSSINFKEDLVNFHKGRGEKVFFIGNGTGDFPAAKESQYAFAIKESKLAKLCRDSNVPCKEIEDFQQVVEALSSF